MDGAIPHNLRLGRIERAILLACPRTYGVTPSDGRECWYVDPAGSASERSAQRRAVRKLVRAGLVTHIDDEQPEAGPHRRRRRCYYLTPLGERVVDLVRTRLATPGERLRWDGVRTILARIGQAAH
jgi:hypothetical protein